MKVNITSLQPRYHYDFTVANTGIIGIYGVSGSGKSSLLSAIAGYNNHQQATIQYNNKALHGVIKCSYMTQHPILFSHWTIAENLNFALSYSKNSQSKLADLVAQLSCLHLLNKYPSQLSGGEKQRIAFIRALILIEDESLVLLDEPFSALDNKLRKVALNLLNQYKNNNLIYLVTHEISELYQVANELIYINQGKVLYHDKIEKAMANNLHKLPVASKIQLDKTKLIIYADDVSISLTKHIDSSIIHQLETTIKEIRCFEDAVILELVLSNSQQKLFAKITKDSLIHLNLQEKQQVIANFKATSLK